jgi:hypothetical protein
LKKSSQVAVSSASAIWSMRSTSGPNSSEKIASNWSVVMPASLAMSAIDRGEPRSRGTFASMTSWVGRAIGETIGFPKSL